MWLQSSRDKEDEEKQVLSVVGAIRQLVASNSETTISRGACPHCKVC